MRSLKILSLFSLVALVFLVLSGCGEDFLTVENQNAPDRERALASAEDVEALIAGSYLDFWGATQYSVPSMGLSTAADEYTSSWGNWHMQNASTEPRIPYDNSSSYRYRTFNQTPWFSLYSAISSANDGLVAINNGLVIGDATRTARAKAFAKFVQGLAHGWLALFFDQAFIFDETVDLETDQLEMQPYNEVMDAAIAMLEEAVAMFNATSFEIPDTWINGNAFTNTDLAKLTHFYIARYLAQVARTPAEREAVDWSRVLDHANQGITEDVVIVGDGNNWWSRLQHHGQNHIWTRADYHTIGPSDTSGNYQAWLDTPLNDKQPFLIHTSDQRVTNGDPEGPGTDFRHAGPPRHRPDRGTYHFSFYQHYRWEAHHLSGGEATVTLIRDAENDMLKAEALFRLGMPGAADLVNKTRVARGGLPPASDSDPDLWDKIVYEKKFETFATSGGVAFFDARGWGLLITGTPLHWPVPGRELETLQMPIYTFGGVGGPWSAPKRAREPVEVRIME